MSRQTFSTAFLKRTPERTKCHHHRCIQTRRNKANTAMAMAPLSLEKVHCPEEEPSPESRFARKCWWSWNYLPTVQTGDHASIGSGSSQWKFRYRWNLLIRMCLPQSNANDLSTVGLLAAFAVVIAVLECDCICCLVSKLDEQIGNCRR